MDKRRRALGVGRRLAQLTGSYPPPDEVIGAAGVGKRERAILARLWISEGIPFAFRKCPALYEEVRNWLAVGLELDAKQVSVAGSGRLGYSLAPKRWGERYRSESSDLDFFVVSTSLFESLRGDFDRWTADYMGGVIQPSKAEWQYWENNRKETPNTIDKGFIDSWRVPNRVRYRQFLRMNRRLNGLSIRLRGTDHAPRPPKALSLRCYRDWGSYEQQAILSLEATVRVRRSRTP